MHVWLSASDTTHVLFSRDPLQRIAAFDLDGDHYPELIARDSQSRIHVWTHRRTGFHKIRPHRARSDGLTTPAHRHVDDRDGQPANAFGSTPFSMSAPLRTSLRAPPIPDSRVITTSPARRLSSVAAADPFAPRPPPAPRLL